MKTVFAHALLEAGEITSIYNVLFDRTGQLLISGADDGYYFLTFLFFLLESLKFGIEILSVYKPLCTDTQR